jgi:hypothetical protein
MCHISQWSSEKLLYVWIVCFFFKATFQMTDLTHLCTMLPEIAAQIVA